MTKADGNYAVEYGIDTLPRGNPRKILFFKVAEISACANDHFVLVSADTQKILDLWVTEQDISFSHRDTFTKPSGSPSVLLSECKNLNL